MERPNRSTRRRIADTIARTPELESCIDRTPSLPCGMSITVHFDRAIPRIADGRFSLIAQAREAPDPQSMQERRTLIRRLARCQPEAQPHEAERPQENTHP